MHAPAGPPPLAAPGFNRLESSKGQTQSKQPPGDCNHGRHRLLARRSRYLRQGHPPQPAAVEPLRGGDPLRARHPDRRSGALVAYSGEKTGRSPKDKRIVRRSAVGRRTSGGATVNMPLDAAQLRRSTASGPSTISTPATASTASTASPAGTPHYRIKVRVICTRPYHALFMHTMLIRPTPRRARSRSASPTT